NYDRARKDYSLPLERLGISTGNAYSLVDIFTGETKNIRENTIALALGGKDGRLYKIVKP
ncbi:MAG: hypothetical protein V4581_17850, partial [Bacteroidota bacterium]